ncbi:hypothetical protein E4U54_005313, partial [Claviceps lovelessii]
MVAGRSADEGHVTDLEAALHARGGVRRDRFVQHSAKRILLHVIQDVNDALQAEPGGMPYLEPGGLVERCAHSAVEAGFRHAFPRDTEAGTYRRSGWADATGKMRLCRV